MMLKNHKLLVTTAISVVIFLTISSLTFLPLNNELRTVVLDAGHGGKDPGCSDGREKKITLDITLRLGEKIKENYGNGVKVIYTRDDDTFVPLHKRAAIANKNKADLFISIHCNSNKVKSIRGTETYVMGLHKTQENLDLAKSENSSILFEEDYNKTYKGYNPKSPLAHIMMANYQNAFMKQSMDFAAKVEKNITKVGHNSRGVKQAGFIVIWETTMPSVLIETGYLTNVNDSNFLGTGNGRENVATAIYKAFVEYKHQVEK